MAATPMEMSPHDEETLIELDDIEMAYGPDGPEGRGVLQVTSR